VPRIDVTITTESSLDELYDALREGVSELKLAGDGYEEEGRLPEQERVDRSLLALEDVLKSLRGGTEPSRV
jgi:hypothetical protein